MKKAIIFVVVIGLIVAGIWVIRQQQEPAELLGPKLLPSNTMLYSGSRSTLKTRAALSLADFSSELESLGLSAEDSETLEAWLDGVDSVHMGLIGFSLMPFSLDAAIILEGDFDDGLMSVLPAELTSEFQEAIPYRDVSVHMVTIPLNPMFQMELFVTDPVGGVTLVTLSRAALNSTVDRLLDGGPSLADQPDYLELSTLPDIQSKDVVSYLNLNAYFETVFGLVRMIPVPAAQQIPQVLREEFRLDEWGPSISGQSLLKTGQSISFSKFPVDMPIYQHMLFSRPVDLSGIPADIQQASMMQLADPAAARQQITDLASRIFTRVGPLFPGMPVMDNPVAMVEMLLGFSLSEIDPLLSGEVGMWQTITSDLPDGTAVTYCIGITDPDAVRQFITERVLARMGKTPIERDGIFGLAGLPEIAWAIQSNRLLICDDPSTLSAQLKTDSFLMDSPEFIALRKQLPADVSSIQYSDYSDMEEMLSAQATPLPPQVTDLFELFESLSMIQGSVADQGCIRTDSIVNHDISGEDVSDVFQALLELMGQ